MSDLKRRFKVFIKTRPCCVCSAPPPNDFCHFTKRGYGGMGMKGSDFLALPMCHKHHMEQHSLGMNSFQHKYNSVDLQWEVMLHLVKFIEGISR